MKFLVELRRRNVIRAGVAYLAVAWLLVQVADTILPRFGFDDDDLRVVITLIGIGLMPALVIAWLYQLTPKGLRREGDEAAADAIPVGHARIDRLIMATLALALGYFMFDKFVLDPQRDAERVAEAAQTAAQQALAEAEAALPERSIAVMPFLDLSAEQDQEYFSDGIAEELLNLLTRVPGLRVISRASSFQFKGREFDVRAIAGQLQVAHVLTGSVRKQGDQVRVTAQLVDARNDSTLWSGTYDRALDNIFSVQDQIANLVVRELKITLLQGLASEDTTEPAVYAMFLQARHHSQQLTPEALEQAATLLKEALTLDPDFAPAWAELAGVIIKQASAGLRELVPGFEAARDAARRAVGLNRNNASAHAYLAWIAMYFDNDLQAAARHYEIALELEPAPKIVSSAATLSHNLGRLEETIELRQWVIEHDPISANGFLILGNTYLDALRGDHAIEAYSTALQLSPGIIGAAYGIGLAHLLGGDPAAALAAFDSETDEEYRVKGRTLALHDLGREAEYLQEFENLRRDWGVEWPSEIAHVYAWTGQLDAAFEWLDRALEIEAGLNEQFLLPYYERLRSDPRWQTFVDRIGSNPDQLAAVEFSVTLPE